MSVPMVDMRNFDPMPTTDAPMRTAQVRADRRAGRGPGAQAGTGAGIIDLRAFAAVLRRRAGLIAGIAFLTLGAAILGLFLTTPRFTATAVMIVDPRQQRVLPAEAVLAGIGADAAAVESQVEVIASSGIAQTVIGELGLETDLEFTRPSLTERAVRVVRELVGRPQETTAAERSDRVLARFVDILKVARRGLTYVLEVKFTSEDAEKAARIANAVTAAYLADQTGAKSAATRDAAVWLDERVGDLRRRVADAERAVATYKAENSYVETGEGRTLQDRQVSELNQQLTLAQARTAEAKARLDAITGATAAVVASGAIPEALLSPVVANLRGQYAEAARRDAETVSTYGPRHPAVAAAHAQLADTRSQIDREIARIVSGIRNEYAVARSRELSLSRSLAELTNQAARAGQASVRLRELEREATASRTLLEQSMLRLRETSEQEGLQRPDARVLSPAVVPSKPSEPKTVLVLLAGLAGALVMGVGAAGIAENLSRGFRTSREVEDSLSIPVIGHLPLVDARAVARRQPRGRPTNVGPGRDRTGRLSTAAARARAGLDRLGVDQPLTAFGEALRTVRSRLAAEAGGRPQVVTVLSAVPNEGKSTIAANLAHSFAKSGLSTLLVDVDVRKSGALRRGGADDRDGLLQILASGSATLPDSVRTDPFSGLRMLSLGRVDDVSAASELLTGKAMRTLLGRLRSTFQVIVLDSPPLLPVVDGRELLEHADVGLFVIEWNRTDPNSASAALDTVGSSIRKIAGVVLNKVDPRVQRDSYGYAYGAAS